MEREDAAAAILERARRARPRWPRALWIAAAIVGLVCAIAFVALLLAEPDPTATPPPARGRDGHGFLTGLVVGVAVGIAVGIALGRQLGRQRHSSRSNP